MLRVVTCAAVHFLIAESPPNALTRITVPLSILAVAGWSVCRHGCACRLPWRWWRPCWRWLCFNVPGGIYQVDASESYTNNLPGGMLARQLLILWHDQSAGLRYLERLRRSGAVSAPWYLSMSIPRTTARQVFAAYPMWQPVTNSTITNTFYSPALHRSNLGVPGKPSSGDLRSGS